MIVAAVVLVALVVAGGLSLVRPTRPVALSTAALAAAWLPVNHVSEGATLIVLSANHGVTVADLGCVAGVALAVLAVLRWRQHADATGSARRRRPTRPSNGSDRDRATAVCLVAIALFLLAGIAYDLSHQPGPVRAAPPGPTPRTCSPAAVARSCAVRLERRAVPAAGRGSTAA